MIIDSHCHLDYEPLVNNINEVLLNAKKNNIKNLLTIGTSLESSKKVLEIVEKYENIYGAIGIHPHSTTLPFTMPSAIWALPCVHSPSLAYNLFSAVR